MFQHLRGICTINQTNYTINTKALREKSLRVAGRKATTFNHLSWPPCPQSWWLQRRRHRLKKCWQNISRRCNGKSEKFYIHWMQVKRDPSLSELWAIRQKSAKCRRPGGAVPWRPNPDNGTNAATHFRLQFPTSRQFQPNNFIASRWVHIPSFDQHLLTSNAAIIST